MNKEVTVNHPERAQEWRNVPYDQLEVGQSCVITRRVTENDFYVFAQVSGNLNPMHLAGYDGDGDGAPEAVAPSMWLGALISSALGNVLPGPGTLYHAQDLEFLGRAKIGDTVEVCVTVQDKKPDRVVVLDTTVKRVSDEELLVRGQATVIAPEKQLVFEDIEAPSLRLDRHEHFERLFERCDEMPALRVSVAAPDDENSLGGALLAAQREFIVPILVGDEEKIREVAREIGESLEDVEIVNEPDDERAAAAAVALVHAGRADAVMKGHLHTDQLLRHVIKSDGGLRTHRRLSHVFIMDTPGLNRLLFVSDAAINIQPTLSEKVDITQNAIDVARALGVEVPKVAVLSAVETVNPKIPGTLDAAALAKMSERGQIKHGKVDGPLAMDNAIDLGAARTKGINSMVAGQADILIVPNLEAGNMLAKELTYVAMASAAGLVVGAKVPVIVNSRADDEMSRLASCAVALMYHAEFGRT
ncbi:MAG: bifunctional enoyl-CoA hydratase/phosphate acetyltransferase [Myxococcota bacterium]